MRRGLSRSLRIRVKLGTCRRTALGGKVCLRLYLLRRSPKDTSDRVIICAPSMRLSVNFCSCSVLFFSEFLARLIFLRVCTEWGIVRRWVVVVVVVVVGRMWAGVGTNCS